MHYLADERLSPIASDIKLETESDFSSDEDFPSRIDLRYQPKKALKVAMLEWLSEIRSSREPPRQPFPRVIPTLPPITNGPPGVPTYQPPGPPLVLTPSPPPSSPPGVPSCPPGNPSIPPGVTPFPPDNPPTPQEIPSAPQPCMDPAILDAANVPEGVPYLPPSPPAGLPLPDVIKTCLTPATTTTTVITSGITPLPLLPTTAQPPEPIPTFLQPETLPVSSLSELPPADVSDPTISDSMPAGENDAEPMDIVSPECEKIDVEATDAMS